jgi:uncharacterized protein YndB with AHSA1/START domain
MSHWTGEPVRRRRRLLMADEVRVTEEVDSPADRVWAMVTDVTRMGQWSPENEGATWLGGATGPTPGARFRGRNRNGKRTWKTTGTIVEAEPGRMFSFRVTALGLKSSEWRYEFDPTPGGCRVTESWIDQRGAIVRAAGKLATGVEHDATSTRVGMEQTLRRLKSAAESASPSP